MSKNKRNMNASANADNQACILTMPQDAKMKAVKLYFGEQRTSSFGKFLLPFSASLMVMSQAYGFGMQELKINSSLGQPLRATVPLNLNSNERANSNCFQIVNPSSASGLPTINKANTRLVQNGSNYSLSITSSTGVVEPISEITIATNCTSLPRMERTFMVMLDPESETTVTRQNTRSPRTEYSLPNSGTQTYRQVTNASQYQPQYTRPRFVAPSSPIQQGTTHVVSFGESLTEIAARVTGRQSGSLWRMAAAIHAANPNAFYNGDPNHLEVGASINIPTINNGFTLTEQQAQQTLVDPAYRASGNSNEFIVTNPITNNSDTGVIDTLETLTFDVSDKQTSEIDSSLNTAGTNTPASNQLVAVPNTLPTLTLSSSLSSVSIQRIQARAQGQILKEFIPDNSDLFGLPNEEKDIVKEAVLTASRETESVASETIQETVTTIDAPAQQEKGFSWTSFLTWLLGLLALGFATWKLLLPRLQRQLRIWNIRRHRAHIKKRHYIERQNERRRLIEETGSVRAISPEVKPSSYGSENTGLFEAPSWTKSDKPELDFELDKTNNITDTASTGVMKSIRLDDNTKIDLGEPLTGPRKATVAKSVYDVEMIDDTGELASLTTAFPELEAELNARIGEDAMDNARDAIDTRLTEVLDDINVDSIDIDFDEDDTLISQSTAKMEADIDIDFEAIDIVGATQTMRVDSSDLDLDLPGLMDSSNELDFESVASGDQDFSKTKVFNEEIFKDTIDASELSDTFSTESIKSEDVTRVAEVLIDEDGLRPEDFGVSTEELSSNRDDYGYLEADASIITESLNIDFDELEELGLDDDNIIPFDPKKKKRSA